MNDQRDDRPNPDVLLERIERQEARAARGQLKIFFGASPGVGKTYAMVAEAQRLREQGRDVVVGVVETHGRTETTRLIAGLEVLPRRRIEHRGRTLDEFDLDAALARKPSVLLVDEFAHANAPGSRHPKRYQDVLELIGAGIDVYTTVNVQHLDSLNDIVGGITGVTVRETLPDRVFDEADEVVLVDLPPDRLLQRMREGKVHFSEQAARAVQNFFRQGNLIALRVALALRRTADRVDTQMRTHRVEHVARGPVWKTSGSEPSTPIDQSQQPSQMVSSWKGYGGALLLSTAATLIAFPLRHFFEPSNIVMLFLLAVVAAALLFGRGPAVLGAIVNVLAFDFFFVPPQFTFAVSDAQNVFTFAVMLVVGLVVGQLTAGLRHQASVAALGEERARRLFDMASELSAALAPEQITEIGERFVSAAVRAKAAIVTLAEDETLRSPTRDEQRPDVDMEIARWCIDHAEGAGTGTDTLPAAGKLYLPLKAPARTRGALVIEPRDAGQFMVPEQRRLLETCAALIAIALERVHFVTVAQRTLVDMESERLRNSVLAALSHDLRTPLTSLVGLSETLAHELASEPRSGMSEVALAIRDQARRTAHLVTNLLEMARLEAGRVNIRREWQSIEELVGSALASLEPSLGERPVEVDVAAELPLVSCDGTLIERVLFNLIENAIKYTPPGSPIRISARAVEGRIEVAVEDRGPGLPRGRERAIFDKFTRGEVECVVPGVGLGLAICRAIVEVHGGTIYAQNREGGGARFIFTLPTQEPPAGPPEL